MNRERSKRKKGNLAFGALKNHRSAAVRGLVRPPGSASDKEYFAYKYGKLIFSVSDYTCTMIPNNQSLYLKQVKDEPSTVFRVRVRALIEWQNRSKVAFAFVFSLDAFAYALCIN